MIALAVILAAAPCRPPAPDAPVKVVFPAGATLDDLERVAVETLCRERGRGGARALTIAVDGTVLGRQVPALIRLLAESAGEPAAPESTATITCPPLPPGAIVPVDPWTRKIAAAARAPLFDCGATQLRIVPNFVDGKADGFKVFSIRPGSVFEQLGLQNGDVVTAVNGAGLETAEAALAAAAQLKTAPQVKLTVRRAKEARTITWLGR